MIWTWPKTFSFSEAYQKRICVGDLSFHKYCFVRCNLSGDTGNKSPLALQECNPVFFPSFKHNSLCYLYYALDASGFLEKSTFLSTQQPYSACIDNMGVEHKQTCWFAQCHAAHSCWSEVLMFFTVYYLHSLLWSQIFRLKIMQFCWQDEISVSEKKEKVKLHSLFVHIFKSWGTTFPSRKGGLGVGIPCLSRHLDGSGLLAEKLLLSICFLLSIETEIL